MRLPRFTILQLFLVTALCGLLAGWWTQSRRAGIRSSLQGGELSPDGRQLAVAYGWGTIDVWDVSGHQPKLVANRDSSSAAFLGMRFIDGETVIVHEWTGRSSELVAWNVATSTQRLAVQVGSHARGFDASLDGTSAATIDGLATPAGANIDLWDLQSAALSDKNCYSMKKALPSHCVC